MPSERELFLTMLDGLGEMSDSNCDSCGKPLAGHSGILSLCAENQRLWAEKRHLMKEREPKLKTTPPEDIIITRSDLDVHLGSGELKLCPFCGKYPQISGLINRERGTYVQNIICPDCYLQMCCCMLDTPEGRKVARKTVVERWNKRSGKV